MIFYYSNNNIINSQLLKCNNSLNWKLKKNVINYFFIKFHIIYAESNYASHIKITAKI